MILASHSVHWWPEDSWATRAWEFSVCCADFNIYPKQHCATTEEVELPPISPNFTHPNLPAFQVDSGWPRISPAKECLLFILALRGYRILRFFPGARRGGGRPKTACVAMALWSTAVPMSLKLGGNSWAEPVMETRVKLFKPQLLWLFVRLFVEFQSWIGKMIQRGKCFWLGNRQFAGKMYSCWTLGLGRSLPD